MVAVCLIAIAIGILVWGLFEWAHRGFGDLTTEATVRAMIIAMTCLVVGVQAVMSAFLASFINIPLIERRVAPPETGGPDSPLGPRP